MFPLNVTTQVWTRSLFNVRPHSMGETRFFCFVGKPFKKKVWSRHLFLFYFIGEKQNKKKKTLNVTPDKKRQV